MKKLIALFLTLSIVLSAFGVSTILPVMAVTSPVKLQIDFEGRNAENKVEGFGDGQIVGSPTFVESYDGSVALHIENDFSKTAQQYLKISDASIGDGDFTVSFWYQATDCGGQGEFSGSSDAEYSGFKNWANNQGGTVFSTGDTLEVSNNGVSVLNLPKPFYGTFTLSDGTTTINSSNRLNHGVLENITDTRWHKIQVVFDKTAGNVAVYVDGVSTFSQSVSSFGSVNSGLGSIGFGADALGQYGALSASFDDIEICTTALKETDISNEFAKDNLKKLINNIKNDLIEAEVGTRFTFEAIENMSDALSSANATLSNSESDFVAIYEELNGKYLQFLEGNEPIKSILITSDTHLKAGTSATFTYNRNNFLNILDKSKNIKWPSTTLINAGDYDENRIDNNDGEYFGIVKEQFLNKVENATTAVCTGNHQYTHPDSTGGSSTLVDQSDFMENCSEYIDPTLEPNLSLVDANGKLKKTYYYVTDGAMHYVVLNYYENSPRKLTVNFSNEQAAWMDSTLQYCSKDGKPIMVISHMGALPKMSEIMAKYDKVMYLWGDNHRGFGSNIMLNADGGYTDLNLPCTFFQRSEYGYVGGGAYFAYLYEDQLVLRAYNPENSLLMPEYDRVIKLEQPDYEELKKKEIGTQHTISGLNGATASSFGYTASVQNTNVTKFTLDNALEEYSQPAGKLFLGTAIYKKDSADNYSCDMYNLKYKAGLSLLSDGEMDSAAMKLNGETYKSTAISTGTYLGGDYKGTDNATLKEAITAGGLRREDTVYGAILFKADALTTFSSLFLSLGSSANYTTRDYDIYVSTSKEDIFEDYNRVFTYKQNKAVVNTCSTQYYYDWDNKMFTTDSAFANNTVTWGNAQYIEFTSEEKPYGKYLALVARDAGTTTYYRADVNEFRVFTDKPQMRTIHFEDYDGNRIEAACIENGKSVREGLKPSEIESIEALIPKRVGELSGRTILGQKYLWNFSYDTPVETDMTFKAVYTQCNHTGGEATCTQKAVCSMCDTPYGKLADHNYNNGVVTTNPTCTKAGVKTYTCNCGDFYTEVIPLGDHTPVVVKGKEATCTATGLTEGSKCSVCQKVLEAQTTISKKPHTKATVKGYAATCTKEGLTDGVKCSVCKATLTKQNAIAKKAHKYETKTTKATLSKNGKTVKKCTACGKNAGTTTIYAAKTVKLSTTSYTYNSSSKKPTVTVKDSAGKKLKNGTDYTVSYAKGCKNVGTYKVIVEMKGKHSGTTTLTFKINPPKTSIKKLTAAKKSLKVSINKKTTQVTGYEIQYSTSKKFKSAKKVTIKKAKTTSATIKKLKAKKTYYVRVRAYKTVGKTKYYSGWSTYKTKKTK